MKLISFEHRGRQLMGEQRGETVISQGEEIPLSEIVFLPPVVQPKKIICVGRNYAAHAAEMGKEVSERPLLFVRFATTLVGHKQPILKPAESERLDYEGELAVIIGKRARRVKAEQALEIVAGYSCFNDASARDWQAHTSQFTAGKNFDATGAFGPWMVTADEIPDPTNLSLTTRLNGEVVQQANTSHMIFPVTVLIEYVSSFCTLEPGDVIATGTPAGVGDKRTPPLYLKAGDVVEVEIDRVGLLANPIEAD